MQTGPANTYTIEPRQQVTDNLHGQAYRKNKEVKKVKRCRVISRQLFFRLNQFYFRIILVSPPKCFHLAESIYIKVLYLLGEGAYNFLKS